MRTPHLSCRQGKRVLIKLRDGTRFVAKFKEKKGNFIHFLDHYRVPIAEILVFSIYKPTQTLHLTNL